MNQYLLFWGEYVETVKDTTAEMVDYLETHVDDYRGIESEWCIRSFDADKNGRIQPVTYYKIGEFLGLYKKEPEESLRLDKDWFLFGFERLLDQASENLTVREYAELIDKIHNRVIKYFYESGDTHAKI